jgi:hypothetical protein
MQRLGEAAESVEPTDEVVLESTVFESGGEAVEISIL